MDVIFYITAVERGDLAQRALSSTSHTSTQPKTPPPTAPSSQAGEEPINNPKSKPKPRLRLSFEQYRRAVGRDGQDVIHADYLDKDDNAADTQPDRADE